MILIVLEAAGIGFQHDWEEGFHVVTWCKMTETETRMTLNLSNQTHAAGNPVVPTEQQWDHQWPETQLMRATPLPLL